MEDHPDQECRGVNNDKTLFNTLDQNITRTNIHLCPNFELIVLKRGTLVRGFKIARPFSS